MQSHAVVYNETRLHSFGKDRPDAYYDTPGSFFATLQEHRVGASFLDVALSTVKARGVTASFRPAKRDGTRP